MARRPAVPKGPTPVESTKHTDKRVNIPTADARDFVGPEVEAMRQVAYARDPSLDPQLIWRGKYEQDQSDLVADAPPIYIQEKIDPRVLIRDLRRASWGGEGQPQPDLFESFDGLGGLDSVDFYRHPASWSNRMILGDSLQVMASLADREALRGQVQMIYLDPPYGIKFGSNWQVSARKRDVRDGRMEDAAREAEQIKAFRDTWELGIHSYLSYLRDRLIVARDLLTESGSIFVQIGDENVHLVRGMLDEVFGSEHFISLITFSTTGGATSEFLAGTADYVLWYAKDRELAKFRRLYTNKGVGGAGASKYTLTDEIGRLYRLDNLTSQSVGRAKGEGAASWFPVQIGGREFRPSMQARWKTNQQGMLRLRAAGRVVATKNTLSYVRRLDDFPAFAISNTWTELGGVQSRADPKVYVVQTNTRVIERCMLMTTDPGDLVLDPTCGSGTTAFVAEQWGRRWITVDTSRVALALARQRLMGAKFSYYLLADSEPGLAKEQEVSQQRSAPGPVTNDIRRGFVYERVQHITLKSIANNPDIHEGMSREAIDAAIAKHAEFELLYDRPYEDTRKVRVTGPFTVESLSPHRSLAFAGGVDEADRETISQQRAAADVAGPTFEQSILDNLRKAGIQNGRLHERITFSTLEPFAGKYLQAVGERAAEDADDGEAPSRIAIAIGPQYGTVDPGFIKAAVREAVQSDIDLLDLVCVLGFAFDPQAGEITEEDGVTVDASDHGFAEVAGQRQLGKMQVLFVRMNADLLMGEDLKKTGQGNLFTVFGEPDLEIIATDDGQFCVDLRGIDVYDPTTGAVRSGDTSQVALWMIDTDYNEESFFVRHCYFTGGGDPYARLKRALKSDIDEEAWEALRSTTSRPFDKPQSGRIAVKVINDYGDEVMKVFEVGEA